MYNALKICLMSFQFLEHSKNMKLKDEYKHLKFLLSDESLALLPEYQQRVQVCLSVRLSVCYQIKASPSYQSTNSGFRYVCLSVCLSVIRLKPHPPTRVPTTGSGMSVCPSVCLLSD